ncbi:hypothetical protein [Sphingomonas solaris]|uniref:Uncharacterized protein n=1 Tax=Alterirhizorhabdus solaris TaxID=2529389 RepID=A0A558R141_9SPHN|nr:hypothetical protein [Sphingomonas solaris]TVV73105.1 hypothetical protein FOY91_12970 [Sphingomonas solaris]
MALAALISACRAIDESGEGLRATLPLAGGTLVEHQARLAAAAGAGPIIILVERLPATLTAAVDRLRREGLRVEIARSLADAVDRVHPDETLLVMADGGIAGADVVRRVAEAESPALLTVPDDADHARFERIDATARWGGLLLIDGGRLRQTAAMLGEWDLQSTLLRRAVQEGAARLAVYEEGDALLAIAEGGTEAETLDRAVVAAARGPAADWPGRFLFPPLVDLVALPLIRRGIAPVALAAGAAALALLAIPFALYGWRWTALALLLLSGPVAAIATRLADIRLATIARAGALTAARALGATLALLLLAADLATTAGWGCTLLAAIVPAAMLALRREAAILARFDPVPPPIWLASLDGLVWAFLPAAIAGSWLGGIALVASYAAGSFAFVQHRLARLAGTSGT